MAKKGKEQQKPVASKHVTTRRLARWQREKRRQRITLISGIAIVILVVGIIIGGVFATRSSDWLSKVQTDSGTVTIKKAEYLDSLKLFQFGLYNSSTMSNDSPLMATEDNYLIQDKAKELGISATESEIDNTILTQFGMSNKSYTDTDFQTQFTSMISNYGISTDHYRAAIKNLLLVQKLQRYYVNETPATGEQAAIETIVTYNASTADMISQLWRQGESFETLTEEYGSLSDTGWVVKGQMDEEFDNVAFSIDIGNVSNPIPSDTGYYVIKVLERTEGPIPEELRQQNGLTNYYKWYAQERESKVERNPRLDLGEVYDWAVGQLS